MKEAKKREVSWGQLGAIVGMIRTLPLVLGFAYLMFQDAVGVMSTHRHPIFLHWVSRKRRL